MPITFNSNGGFLNGTISSSNGDLFIATSGSVGAINVGQQLQLTGSQIIEKDLSGNVRNKKTFNSDGTITQEKFDTGGKTTETKVKDPDSGKEFIRSGSATTNQIEFQQNSSGAFITVSGSIPGYNIIKTGATNDYRTIRQTTDFFYANNNAIFTVGVDGVGDNTWFVNPSVLTGADSNSVLRVSASGDVFVKGNIHAQEFHTELISSSIVFQSGSTLFGNSHDDTHTFTGKFTNAITASADISSSGTITGNELKGTTISISTAANVTSLTNLNVADTTGQTGVDLSLSALNGRMTAVVSGLDTDDNVQFNHITASGNISSSGTITMLTASIGGGIFTSASLAAGGSGGDSSFTAAGISGSLGSNAATIRTLTKASISGSLGENATLIRSLTAAGISGSITDASSSLASRTATLEGNFVASAASISGSLGPNATLIRSLSAANISGSFTSASSSLSTRVSLNDAKVTANTSNVTSAGALMDSEVTSLALIKGLTAASISGSLGGNATLIRSLTANSISGSLGSNATLIRTLTANSISGSTYSLSSSLAGRVTTNEVKLDGIESSADVTDTSNVTSAGALMDSEVTSLALIKTITAADISGSSTALSSSLASRTTTLEGNGVFTAASISGSTYSLSSSLAGRVTANEVVTAKTLVSSSGQINSLINDTIAATIVAEIDNDEISGDKINGGTIGSITITDLTATKLNVTHFTSSFITSSTIQTEGSNIFGDTIADTHLFNGHITASGNISASGRVTTLQVGRDSTDQIDFSTDNVMIFKVSNANRMKLNSSALRPNSDEGIALGTTAQKWEELVVNHITASGEISSSDRVIAKRFNADGTLEGAGGYAFRLRDDTGMYEEGFNVGVLAPENVQIAIDSNGNNNDISDPAQFVIVHNNAVLDSSPANPLFQVFEDGRTLFSTASAAGVTINHLTGHITASGNISASGTGIFNKLEIHGADSTLAADYIIHKDDDNTKFGFPQNDKFKIRTAGTDRYVVDTTHQFTGNITADSNISSSVTSTGSFGFGHFDGRVGIGTKSPDAELHILGPDEATLKLDATSGQPAIFFAQSDNAKWEMRAEANKFQLHDYTAGEWVFNIINEKVGIGTGTATPGEALEVVGNISASGNVTTNTGSFNEINIPADNQFIKVGASGDLQLYHNGSNSFIDDAGTGELRLRGSTRVRLQGINEENMVVANEGGAVNLYHDNNQKLATTATGIDVTGNITASGNISSSGKLYAYGADFGDQSITNVNQIDLDGFRADSATAVQVSLGASGVDVVMDDGDSFTINSGEIDADFTYFDSGEASLIHGDAALSRVGISDTSPVSKLDVGGDLNVQSHITASGNISSSGVIYGKQIQHTYHQFDNASNASVNYIPAPGGYVIEGTSINYYRKWLAPYKGKIKKIVIHAENDCGTTRVSLYTNGIFSGYHQQALGATTAVVFDDFTGGLSGNPNFDQHDLIAIAVDPANIPGEVNLVCSWEYEIDS